MGWISFIVLLQRGSFLDGMRAKGNSRLGMDCDLESRRSHGIAHNPHQSLLVRRLHACMDEASVGPRRPGVHGTDGFNILFLAEREPHQKPSLFSPQHSR